MFYVFLFYVFITITLLFFNIVVQCQEELVDVSAKKKIH